MDPYYLILLIALAVALGVWGLAQLVLSLSKSDRRKLKSRLSSEWRSDVKDLAGRSILLEPQNKDLSPALARSRIIRGVYQKLRVVYPDARLSRFLALSCVIALLTFVLAVLLSDSFLLAIPVAGAAAYLPVLLIKRKAARQQRQIAAQLPEALEFLARILRAGHSLSTGIQMMSEELPAPIGGEFRRCYDQHSLGQSLEDAMREMAGRVASADFAFFVTAVLIQRQTGGDLAEVLTNISAMVRSRVRLQDHVKAITAEGRLTGNILVAFPLVLFLISYVLNPAYAGVLLNTTVGKAMLFGAVTLQMLGLVIIRRIVSVKV